MAIIMPSWTLWSHSGDFVKPLQNFALLDIKMALSMGLLSRASFLRSKTSKKHCPILGANRRGLRDPVARYAEKTAVPVERSQAELAKLLTKHGAAKHGFLIDGNTAAVGFELEGRRVRLELVLPDRESLEKALHKKPPRGWFGMAPSRQDLHVKDRRDQIMRQRWRALVLVTKAKLELIADGTSTVEREFLPDIVLPNGQRVEQWLAPQIAIAYEHGRMPPLLLSAGEQ